MTRRLVLLAVLLWAGGAAAQGAAEPAPQSAAPQSAAPQSAVPQSAAPPAPAPGGQPIPVDRQMNHPNGTTFVVNTISPRRTSTVLDVTVTTGPETSRLNDFGMALVDDQGGRYPVVPPAGDPDITVPKNSAMDGELVFSGRLNPAARRVTLIVNERAGSTDGRVSNTPQMRLDIPLPQRGGEAAPPDGPRAPRSAAGAPLDGGPAGFADSVGSYPPVAGQGATGGTSAPPGSPAAQAGAAGGVLDASRFALEPPAEPGSGPGPDLPDGPEVSRLAAAPLPAPGVPTRVAALVPSRLAAAEQASGTGGAPLARGGLGGGLAASRLTVEQLRRDLGARQTERGEVVSLPGDILFDFDRADIRRDAEPTLRKLADLIAQTRPERVLVEGHTDGRGAEAYNRRLSERRAEAVARWLGANGMDPGLAQSRGFGKTRPVAPNQRPGGADDPDGRQRNRRVEVVLRRA